MGAFLSPFRPVSVMTSVSLFLPPFFAGKVLISTINVLSLHSENDGRTQCMSALWKTPWLLTQSSAGSTVGRACKLIKSVQFKTCTWKSRCALHPISLKFFQHCFWNTVPAFVWLMTALSVLSKKISTSSFHASLLQAIDGAMSLALCPQVVSQAPQHFSSSQTQAMWRLFGLPIWTETGMTEYHPHDLVSVHILFGW